jgi:hypothetical protein
VTEIQSTELRKSFTEHIPELKLATGLLEAAVYHHVSGNSVFAENLFMAANLDEVADWANSHWDRRWRATVTPNIEGLPKPIGKLSRSTERMPSLSILAKVLERDGFHCRFCCLPVIPKMVREKAHNLYPKAVPWGRKSYEQHAAFQAFWLQYDHIVPHSRGGSNDIENIVVACAPCNYGRGNFLLSEVGVSDPFLRPPHRSKWNGLMHFLN